MTDSQPEVWLRGPVAGVTAQLQPVAHALLQAREDIERLLQDYPESELWSRPAGLASVGFHLQHVRGALDRLFTYTRGEPLTAAQRRSLMAEASPPESEGSVQDLADAFHRQVDLALAQLRATAAQTLGDARPVGQKRLPATVLGLLFHAAEHTQRHAGQLLVTTRIQRAADQRAQ